MGHGHGFCAWGLEHGSQRGGCLAIRSLTPRKHSTTQPTSDLRRRFRRNTVRLTHGPAALSGSRAARPLVAQRSKTHRDAHGPSRRTRDPCASAPVSAILPVCQSASLPVEYCGGSGTVQCSAVIISCRRRPSQVAYHHQTTAKRLHRSSKPSGVRPASQRGSNPILDHDHISQVR